MTKKGGLRRHPSAREAGFSLIELIVVITIIGILAATVVVNLAGRSDKARVARVGADFANIGLAASLFKEDHGRWPDNLEELFSPPEALDGSMTKYLNNRPIDPWTREMYQYELTDEGPYLVSFGSDMSEGGDGVARDITNQDEQQ